MQKLKLVLVFAEPGDPHPGESHNGIESAFSYTYECVKDHNDRFFRNVRSIIDLCWPNEPFEQQMRRVWLTESVLCSAKRECGSIKKHIEQACIKRYLIPQLKLFPDALIVALGGKAQKRLSGFIDYHPALHPACRFNREKVSRSWLNICEELKKLTN